MKTQPRRGSWRQVAPGQYTKNIGSYGDVKFGATARVSFVPFPTCEIIDATGAHVGVPTPADQKKFVTAAKKVYTKDSNAETARLQKRVAARTYIATKIPKWSPGSKRSPGQAEPSGLPAPTPAPFGDIAGSINFLKAEIRAMKQMASTDPDNAPEYRKRESGLRARIKKLQA